MKRKSTLLISLVIISLMVGANTAYSAAGDLIWQKRFNFLPQYDRVSPCAFAASSNTLIVCGYANHSDYNIKGQIGFIKAFDLVNGAIKWEKTLTIGANNNNYHGIKFNGSMVFIEGYSSTYTGEYPNYIYTLDKTYLSAYNVDTGQEYWTNEQNYVGSWGGNTNFMLINNYIFQVAFDNYNNGGDCIVSAYQANGTTTPAINNLILEK